MSNTYSQLLDFNDPLERSVGNINNVPNNTNKNVSTTLEFQDFALSDPDLIAAASNSSGTRTFNNNNNLNNNLYNTNNNNNNNNNTNNNNNNNTGFMGSISGFWTLEYYAHYFNVNTNDVLDRIKAIFSPSSDFIQVVNENPDLYGPFWISTTVILALWVTSSIAGSIAAYSSGEEYNYDITLLSFALGTVYIYASAVPVILWGILKYFKAPGHLLHLLDVFGYGLMIWIPVCVLCIIPSEFGRWLMVILAFGFSSYFSIKTVGPLAKESEDKRCVTIVYALTVLFQFALAILFKFGFFKYVYKVGTPGPSE